MYKILFLSLITFFTSYVSLAGDNNRLTIAWQSNVGQLNPHLYSPNQMFAQVLVYEPLVRYAGGDKMEPAIAESWKIEDGGKRYLFNIRKDTKFSDNTPIDAYAVEKNFKAIMLNATRHNWLGVTDTIKSFKATDKYTFVLELKYPYSGTLKELSLPRPFRILSPSGFSDNNTSKGIKKPIGSGAWALKESRLGDYDLFVRNENYSGEKPKFKELLVKVLPDPNGRVIALESGIVDLLIGEEAFSYENFIRLQKDKKFTTYRSEPHTSNSVVLNSNSKILNDINIRKAIFSAVDRGTILHGILLDIDYPSESLFINTLPFCNVGLKPYKFNRDEADKILDNAGWKRKGEYRYNAKGERLTVGINYIGTNPRQKAMAEVMQGDLLKVGIDLKILAEEATTFYQVQKNGNFDMIFNTTWGMPFDPQTFLSSMRVSSHADYQAQLGLSDKQDIDTTITNIMQTHDSKKLTEYYKKLLTTLHNAYIYLPISYSVSLAVHKVGKLVGFEFGFMDTEFMLNKLSYGKSK